MRLPALVALPLVLTACHADAQAPTVGRPSGVVTGPSMESDPQIVTTLLHLMEVKDKFHPSPSDQQNTALKDIIRLGTPRGFYLRNRYFHLGTSLSESFSVADDPRLKEQMLEEARWEREPEVRAVALIALARRQDPVNDKVFDEATINANPGIRFAGMEALETWSGTPNNEAIAKKIFERVMRTDVQPILKVYAAQALARRGVPAGREALLANLDSSDWLARAMAARYLGELGAGEDYDRLLDRMSREQNNDFTLAEYAIACLKLFPKKAPPTAAPPPPSAAPAGAEEGELEPLVITAPRLKIPATALIDGRINAVLLRLLEDRANTPSARNEEQLLDPSLKTLGQLVSPAGFRLQMRYGQIGFLLTEGLAGTSDLVLRDRIMKVARQGLNPQTRAAALLAFAYNHDANDRSLFQEALQSQDFTVRFSAVEALETWAKPSAVQDIGAVSRMDLSPFLQVYAAGTAMRMGDASGRDVIIRHWQDPDWVVRSQAIRVLGEMGVVEDYPRILMELDREPNEFVKAEMAGALLRLHALKARKR